MELSGFQELVFSPSGPDVGEEGAAAPEATAAPAYEVVPEVSLVKVKLTTKILNAYPSQAAAAFYCYYNEEASLSEITARLLAVSEADEIIIVDDCPREMRTC